MSTEYQIVPVELGNFTFGESYDTGTILVDLLSLSFGASYENGTVDIQLDSYDFGRAHDQRWILNVIEPPEIPDTTAPVISNFDPPLGTTIARTDYVQFDVTDDEELTAIFILVRYENGVSECVWDYSSFQPQFLAGSSKVVITDGYRFTLRRAGGWLSTPIIINIVAVDSSGNVTAGVFA